MYLNNKLISDFQVDNETLSKVLKILGLESEEILLKFRTANSEIHDSVSDFKILILTRGLVDKFTSKSRDRKTVDMVSKETEVLQKKLEAESFSSESEFQETEKKFIGSGFLTTLHKSTKKEKVLFKFPTSIILQPLSDPLKIWIENNQLFSKTFNINDLKNELAGFKKNSNQGSASFVLRIEYHSSKSVAYRCFFYEYGEINELIRKIEEISYIKTLILISSFVKFKGIQPSKTRAVFSENSVRVYFIGYQEKEKRREKQGCWVSRFIPVKLINSLQFSKQELDLFEWGFKCKMIFPIKSSSIYFERENYEYDFLKFTQKLATFLKKVVKFSLKLSQFSKFKPKLSSFLLYLSKKLEKIQSFLSKSSVPDTSYRQQWEKIQYIKLSDYNCKIYQVTNSQKISSYQLVFSELLRLFKNYLRNSYQIKSCVADFIDSNDGLFLIKLLRFTLENKKITKLPVISSTKHISLFSATEGSGFVKGKMNRQRLCCGDYCSLLKRNDYDTKEKIEFLMKHYLEYASTLFELLKLQDMLNIDTVVHLLDKSKRPITPITEHMQYKVLRKIILEDRGDRFSLRSLILNLPSEVVRELNLILESATEGSSIEMHLSKSKANSVYLNKKLNWEFELVPVCDKCYKIYSKRIKN